MGKWRGCGQGHVLYMCPPEPKCAAGLYHQKSGGIVSPNGASLQDATEVAHRRGDAKAIIIIVMNHNEKVGISAGFFVVLENIFLLHCFYHLSDKISHRNVQIFFTF